MKIFKEFIEIKKDNKIKRKKIQNIKSLRKNNFEKLKRTWDDKILAELDPKKQKELKETKNKLIKQKEELNTEGNIIELNKVNKFYINGLESEHILKDIDLKIKKGEIVTILGQSGSGKSTLLNIISGLIQAELGSVVVNNKQLMYMNEKELTEFRKKTLSFIFQSYNLIPSLTTKENIMIGSNLREKTDKIIPVNQIIKTLDLQEQARKFPFQLSGGQQQRISIGRSLAKNPKILFADEPTGALDQEKGKDVLKQLVRINKTYKTTIIMVTHNPNIAKLSDKVIKLADGKIQSIKINKTKADVENIKWT